MRLGPWLKIGPNFRHDFRNSSNGNSIFVDPVESGGRYGVFTASGNPFIILSVVYVFGFVSRCRPATRSQRGQRLGIMSHQEEVSSTGSGLASVAGQHPFTALIAELKALSDAVNLLPSPNQTFDGEAAGGATLREVLNIAAGKVAHEVIRTTLVLRSGPGVNMAAVTSLMPPLVEAIGQFVSAVQLITAECSAAFRAEIRGAASVIMKALLEMFGPLASLTAGVAMSSESAGGGGGSGGASSGELSTSPSIANAVLKAACARLAPTFLLHAGQISKLTEAIPRLPPDDLQSLRRSLLTCGKLLKSTVSEVLDEQGLTGDSSFNPSNYPVPRELASAAVDVAAASTDAAAGSSSDAPAAGAGAGHSDSGAKPGGEAKDKDEDDEEGEEEGDFGEDDDLPRLPRARQELFVRLGLVSLHALFGAIKAFQAPVDRTGVALKKAQLLKIGPVPEGADAAASDALAAPALPRSPIHWMDEAHAALAKVQGAVIDFAASINDYHPTPSGLEELRQAARDTESAAGLLQALARSSDGVVSRIVAEAGSSEGIPAHDDAAETSLIKAVARASDAARATVAVAARGTDE